MKKILIGILIILLIVMAYFAIFRGISFAGIKVLSVEQIKINNDNLSKEIQNTEKLMHNDYPDRTEKLSKSVNNLMKAKEEYLDLANVSTEGELSKANKEETYKIEYLWARVGSHATSEGITLKLDVTAGETGESDVKNLSFTTAGNYVAIIEFLRAIEDDTQLGFRIENFKILPGSSAEARQATFTVKNVRIKQENTTATPTANNATTNSDAAADQATNTNNTNNNANNTNKNTNNNNNNDTSIDKLLNNKEDDG